MTKQNNAARVAVQAEPCLNAGHGLTKAQCTTIDDASTQLAVGSEVCVWLSSLLTVIEDESRKDSPRWHLCRDLAGLGRYLADDKADRLDHAHREIESLMRAPRGGAA